MLGGAPGGFHCLHSGGLLCIHHIGNITLFPSPPPRMLVSVGIAFSLLEVAVARHLWAAMQCPRDKDGAVPGGMACLALVVLGG